MTTSLRIKSAETVEITPNAAEMAARSIRDQAARAYRLKYLGDHMQGLLHGQMIMLKLYTRPDPCVLLACDNELGFYCRRADEEGQ